MMRDMTLANIAAFSAEDNKKGPTGISSRAFFYVLSTLDLAEGYVTPYMMA